MSRKFWILYLLLVVIYGILTFLVPIETEVLERYDITQQQGNLLKLTIFVPLIAIWFVAFYGFYRFKRYAERIKAEPDGQALSHIANGLGVLAVSLPVTTLVSSFFEYAYRDREAAAPAITITTNYLALMFSLAAFWLIFMGSKELLSLVKRREESSYPRLVVGLIGILAFVYTYLTFKNPHRQFPNGEVERAAFYLPDWLILLTIVLPYLFVWFIGLLSVSNIGRYNRTVRGILYRQTLGYLAKGIVSIVIFSIVLAFIKDFGSFLSTLSLTPLLGIIYLLVIGIAIGYVFVAIGAKRLQKIEDV